MVSRASMFLLALFVTTIALLLPYRLRIAWFRCVSFFAHLPSRVFASVAGYLIRELDLNG